MIALLCGGKLVNKNYNNGTDKMYLTLENYILEEDGAEAKSNRANNFCYRDEDPEWELLIDA